MEALEKFGRQDNDNFVYGFRNNVDEIGINLKEFNLDNCIN